MKAEVLKLVETTSKMVAGKTQAGLRMKAFLQASADQAERDEPGNEYSRLLNEAVQLLEKGVPPQNVARQMKELPDLPQKQPQKEPLSL